jgi:hypothetical protein
VYETLDDPARRALSQRQQASAEAERTTGGSDRMVFRKLTPYLVGVPLGLATWAAIAVIVTVFPPAGRPVAVYALGGPAAALDAVMAAGGSLLEIRGDVVVAISDDPGFVARLYREAPLLAVLADGGCGLGKVKRV